MKKIHMSREQLVAEAIDLIAEDVQTQAFDGEILPDLLSLIPTEKLIEFLPADEEDEDEEDEEQARYTLAEGMFNALVHWEKCFLDGTLEDEHAEFIAGVLAKARKEVADNFYQACENDMHRKLTKEQD
jgi:hypothetical protein